MALNFTEKLNSSSKRPLAICISMHSSSCTNALTVHHRRTCTRDMMHPTAHPVFGKINAKDTTIHVNNPFHSNYQDTVCYNTAPSESIGIARPIVLFLLYPEDIGFDIYI